MAASIAGRSTFLRTLYKKSVSVPTSSRFSISPSPTSSSFIHPRRISPHAPSSPLRLRRELTSLLPVHSAVASACLVSKLPDRPSTSSECRFANYVSPI